MPRSPLPSRHRHALLILAALLPIHARSDAAPPERLADGITRFTPETYDPTSGPSLALVKPFPSLGPAPANPALTPTFQVTDDDRYRAHLPIPPNTSLYATGEVYGPLLRNGRTTVCWNTDAYGYGETTPSLYQSHPWVLAVREDGSAFGVLADTTWRCEIDLTGIEGGGGGITFTADGPAFRLILIDRPTPQDVLTGLAELTGTMPLPPKWALGYHQCRYSYYPEARVREIADGFRSRAIPCDVIWFDIDYMREYRVFTFDPTHFPDPAKLNADLHDEGFHTIWMIDPGIKAEPGYAVYDSGSAGDHWVKTSSGDPYKGEVWPGFCVFPDYTRPDTRAWWAGLYKDFLATGIDGVWNDMNEPAVFNVPTKTMPEDNRHRGGDRATDSGSEKSGGGVLREGPHAQYHNVYGMLMARATREGIQAANPGKRPFVLTRANYIGGHRYAATWTGDNAAEWDDLETSIPMVLNLGLSGQPFSGPDIGGFIGNGDGPMFARWMGIGALLPFARGHTGKGNIDKEPWAFGAEVERTCTLALQRRMRLLPYLYTLFHEASTTGLPVARPLFFADAKDPALRSEDDGFLLGNDLLVAAQVTPSRDRAVVLPRGGWRKVHLVGEENDPDQPDLYLRPGAIIPLGPIMQHTDERPLDPLTLLVNPDENGRAEGLLYEDAGDGFAYQTGDYLLTRYTATTENGVTTIHTEIVSGTMPRPARTVQVQLVNETTEPRP